jgi:hypothetical protein
MEQRNSYVPAGQFIRLLPIPYVLTIILALIWPLLGSMAMLVYWILVLIISRRLSSIATTWKDAVLSSSGMWLMLAAIAGLGTTILNVLLPIDPHLAEMNAVIDATPNPEIALQSIAPYIVSIMVSTMVAAPMQIVIPAACSLVGWIKFRSHVATIPDVQRYVVDEGVQKLLVAHKLQIVMGFLLAGTIASIWGVFALIATSIGMNGLTIMILLITTLVLGIGVVVTAVTSFFTLIAGYSKTGYALLLVKGDRTRGTGSEPSGSVAGETRCIACGNTFQSMDGIKYCPVCGAALL